MPVEDEWWSKRRGILPDPEQQRSFALPPTVDAGRVNAENKAGVLTIRLPLCEEAKPKQIKVAVAVAA